MARVTKKKTPAQKKSDRKMFGSMLAGKPAFKAKAKKVAKNSKKR